MAPGECAVETRWRPMRPPHRPWIGALEKGDVLIQHTDGVTEARDAERRLFSNEPLLECVGREPATSAKTLAPRITELVQGFAAGAPPSGDITLAVPGLLGP